MSDIMIQLAADNVYVMPKVASVLYETHDFQVPILQRVAEGRRPVFVVSNNLTDDIGYFPPYKIGTVVTIERIEKENNRKKFYVKGLYRAEKIAESQKDTAHIVRVRELPEADSNIERLILAYRGMMNMFAQYAKQEDSLQAFRTVEKFNRIDVEKIYDEEKLTYLINKLTQIAMYDFSFHPAVNQEILEENDIVLRALKVENNIERILIERYNQTYHFPEYVDELPEIDNKSRNEEIKTIDLIENVELRNREAQTRERPPVEESEQTEQNEVDEVIALLKAKGFPEKNFKMIEGDLRKLATAPKEGNDYRDSSAFFHLLTDLPWAKEREERSIVEAEEILHNSHYGLDVAKKEIIKYLAERKLNDEASGAVLCLSGPPGVGKTSLVKSIAEAMNREFVQIKLGGVEREAMIRGFERTYRAAIPGILVKEMSKLESVNPVILLDEIDKIGKSNGDDGDVTAALLEVLDPVQNKEFRDHYLTVPYDLSNVFFVATANDLDRIPAPLKDRMEMIHLDGYTRDEKFHICKNYLVKEHLSKKWLENYDVTIEDEAIMALVDRFSHEPGIRSLERSITSLFREIAFKIETENVDTFHITREQMSEYFEERETVQVKQRVPKQSKVGRVNTLQVMSKQGEVVGTLGRLEVSRFPGSGELTSTGNLSEVLLESVDVALSYVRLIVNRIGIEINFKDKNDFHIHFPEAAVPKDGPSAGIAIVTAIVSALCNEPVKYDVAMTGEISLYGDVSSVGGVKEKVIGAYRAGMQKVIIPQENTDDIDNIPENILEAIDVVTVENMEQAFEHVFEADIFAPKQVGVGI